MRRSGDNRKRKEQEEGDKLEQREKGLDHSFNDKFPFLGGGGDGD